MDSESELLSLFTQLLSPELPLGVDLVPFIRPIISLVSSMDLNSQPKPESEFMSLITQTISVFNSTDFDSMPMPLQDVISFFSGDIYSSLPNSVTYDSDSDSSPPSDETIFTLEPEPEFVSLIHKICSLFITIHSKSGRFILLCPTMQVTLEMGKFSVNREEVVTSSPLGKWGCLPWNWMRLKFPGEEEATYVYCKGCKGKNHEEYKKAPLEIKHHLHRKHSLHLVFLKKFITARQCFCCDEDLQRVFYCCLSCDFAINLGCERKPPVLSIDNLKWHEHTLYLFPRHAFLTCNLCALADASSPIYMCPNCDFVSHLKCISLPRLIRISRHPHRISFTPSFNPGDSSSCGVCRRAIDGDYGGYSCIKEGCSYAAHSRCATQKNVWDGKELEGEPEEEDSEDTEEPFVRISEGIIQHFSHQHHHLKLDENKDRDYDETKECQACIMPIYFGNFYSCIECDFILHEECANLSRKIHHPIHPHLLSLGYNDAPDQYGRCNACPLLCKSGFFYECSKQGCDFDLHVQCATVSEPLIHGSHIHPLFLTSKPEEKRTCSICKERKDFGTNETFNCIEECGFALCFQCATLPQIVRYKHDKHILTLSYGKEETSTMKYWCEVCEGEVYHNQRFYMCAENCCVTLHIECLLGRDLYMKPGLFILGKFVLPNNRHMTRPTCIVCGLRCPYKVFFQTATTGSIFCSAACVEIEYRRY